MAVKKMYNARFKEIDFIKHGFITLELRLGNEKHKCLWNGEVVAEAQGGGYCVRGSLIGDFITKAFQERLGELKDDPELEIHHYAEGSCIVDGAIGMSYLERLLSAIGNYNIREAYSYEKGKTTIAVYCIYSSGGIGEFKSTKEVAELYKVKIYQVRFLVESGKMARPEMFAGKWAFSPSEVRRAGKLLGKI